MSYYSRNHLQDDWDAMERAEAAEREDAEAAVYTERCRTADLHIAPMIKAAKANFDTACAVSAELYGRWSFEHGAAINYARCAYEKALAAARVERALYLEFLRSGGDDGSDFDEWRAAKLFDLRKKEAA